MPKEKMEKKLRIIIFLCISLCLVPLVCNARKNTKKVNFQVGVILDMNSTVGRMGMSCLLMAHSDFYSENSNYSTRLVLYQRDSKGEVIDAAGSALNLLKDVEVDAIIGPQKSGQANFVINLGEKSHTPIISFSATSPSLNPRTQYFVQTALSDEAQVGAIAAIVKSFKWSQIVMIYEDSDYGNGIIPYLANALQEVNARVSYRSVIPVSARDDFILGELIKMKTSPTRVFIVHLGHPLAARLFVRAKELGMMDPGFVWIVTSSLMDLLYAMDSNVVEAMEGIIGVKPQGPKPEELEPFVTRWKREFIKENPDIKKPEISIYGLWAYDTLWALAMAAEKVGIKDQTINKSAKNSTDQFNLATSKVGPELLNALLDTSFHGLNGDFHLLNGQLASPPFQILNVVRKREVEVGIWTPSSGIAWNYSTAKETDKIIVWPGGSTDIPKGWEFPIRGTKLRVGVPDDAGFAEFLEVKRDPHTNTIQNITGYYVEIFDLVMKSLYVPYEFVPFEKSDGSYDDLVYQVFLQKYNAAIGDLTITANRSKYVDFTLPFAEGGVATIMRVNSTDVNKTWGFLKPLKRELWLTSIAFFIFTGVAIWILEHRINPAFRGPISHQLGMILYFPFTTIIFTHREKIVGNLTRIVVIVWIFVVLILTATYTASLSSRFTSQMLTPQYNSLKELINKNETYVGCREGSFIVQKLITLGFKESQIKPCTTHEDCHRALSRGSKNGGISAFLGVVPYVKLFLSKYSTQKKVYTTLDTIYRTDGFAFAFPKGSPLVSDVSRAVINLTESGIFEKIQQKWFTLNYTASATPLTETTVTLESFKALFIITGCVTALCIIIYITNYLYENKDFVLRTIRSNLPFSIKLRDISKHFDQMEESYSRMRKDKSTPDQSPRRNEEHEYQMQLNTYPSLRRSFNSTPAIHL